MNALLTDELLESLLYEDEGAALDFTRPVPVRADHRQKSELLKDALAFVNAFRRTTACVLIGVEDVPGGRGIIHGVNHHPDDAALQQFVNSKTNRPVDFHYRARKVDGQQIGVLEIPVQQRPFYFLKDYGKLKARDVYVRHGSSTDIAGPAEIARMGVSVQASPAPDLTVAFGNAAQDERYGMELAASCTSFQMPMRIPDYTEGPVIPGGSDSTSVSITGAITGSLWLTGVTSLACSPSNCSSRTEKRTLARRAARHDCFMQDRPSAR